MLKYLETKSTTLSENTLFNKFKDKKVLVMGSGNSINEVNWEALDYDCIATTTHFYLNDKIRKSKNITHVTLSEIIDFTHPNLIEFLENNPECTLALEPVWGRPFYNSDVWKNFESKYRDRLIYYNTEISKIEGAAGRLTYFVMAFNPSDLYYVGIDGHAKNRDDSPFNAFRPDKKDHDNGLHSYEKFSNSHINMAKVLYEYSKQNKTKLYNLGEGYNYNCSTPYSKEHFPLSKKIKNKISK
jgi:hypothetical protein|tara:strand:+ start:70 stop:795 length:726 start_codon:yes stop_codon:yes gene_type:complete